MLAWFAVNIGTIILTIVIAVIVALIIRGIIKDKKEANPPVDVIVPTAQTVVVATAINDIYDIAVIAYRILCLIVEII